MPPRELDGLLGELRGAGLRERLLATHSTATRVEATVARWLATPGHGEQMTLMEAQRDTYAGVDSLLTILTTERDHWRAPADGSVLECEFTAAAPAAAVEVAQRAIKGIRDADERRRQQLERIEKQLMR